MFSELWGEQVACVVNGCRDCPLRITKAPRDYCVLTKRIFDISEVSENWMAHRPIDCPLPKSLSIKILPHSYSTLNNKVEHPKTKMAERVR
jgi:hypothetical protein